MFDVNNYIVRLYRVVIVVTIIKTKRTIDYSHVTHFSYKMIKSNQQANNVLLAIDKAHRLSQMALYCGPGLGEGFKQIKSNFNISLKIDCVVKGQVNK